jgi:hypothetical protein
MHFILKGHLNHLHTQYSDYFQTDEGLRVVGRSRLASSPLFVLCVGGVIRLFNVIPHKGRSISNEINLHASHHSLNDAMDMKTDYYSSPVVICLFILLSHNAALFQKRLHSENRVHHAIHPQRLH